MKKIIVVTGSKQQCGIYQYSSCTVESLKKSTKFNFELVTADSANDFFNYIKNNQVYAVVYNYHPSTLPWLNSSITNLVNIHQLMIVGHESVHHFEKVGALIHTDPTFIDSGIEYAGIPPITYYNDIVYTPPAGVLKIGTSGIGNVTKNLSAILTLIQQQFVDEEVIFNVHMTNGDFVDPQGRLTSQAKAWLEYYCGNNIKVNFSNEFMSKLDLIKWLNNNDINLFWYDTPNVPGVSSSIDKALAAKKPIGVNNSSFFKHIRQDWNDVTLTPIKHIVNNGIQPLESFYRKWSPESLINKYEQILQSMEQ